MRNPIENVTGLRDGKMLSRQRNQINLQVLELRTYIWTAEIKT